MTQIRQQAFAERIEEYIVNPASFNQERFDSSLHTVCSDHPLAAPAATGLARLPTMQGLCFSEYIELVMILLSHAFRTRTDATPVKEFAQAMAAAMQKFAEPLADEAPACYTGPYFLLHGLSSKSLTACVGQFENNGRIIHETLAVRPAFLLLHGQAANQANNIKMLMEEGAAEDYFGICAYITRADENKPHGTDQSYIAKTSFFFDTLRHEIIVITLQGQRVYAGQKKRSRNYARLAARLGVDPRLYVLQKVCAIAKKEGYQRLRLIRAEHHPMFIDKHVGFMARYDPLIRMAGFNTENGCYLEGTL